VVTAKVNPGAQEGFTSVREVEAGTNNRGPWLGVAFLFFVFNFNYFLFDLIFDSFIN
jgi:hypothetical protein